MKNTIQIGDQVVGDSYPCFIIAEAGVNHNGDLEIAKKLVDVAKNAGVDAIKFQTFKAESLLVKDAPKAKYAKESSDLNESFFDMIKKLELSNEMHQTLKEYCDSKNLMFLSTPFDIESANYLEKLNINAYKVSSGDIDNFPLFYNLIQKKKPILFSTGTADLSEVIETVNFLKSHNFFEFVLFQCTSAYPTPFSSVNLKVLSKYRELFPNCVIGFSDHSEGIILGAVAVSLGAKIIEKHFTLDRNMKGPDHKASLNPSELKDYVTAIRNTETALGNPNKSLMPIEEEVKFVARKSIVSRREIKKGEVFTSDDITYKRPASGISPKEYLSIIGRRAKHNIIKDKILSWDDFE